MTTADAFSRARAIERLREDHFDVLVIGGGITGAGVALDAANRGYTTALVERDDFAAGTSSKSSKLVHGGLRYLQQGEFGLVYEALAERQTIRRIAPHLVQLMPFMIPMFRRNGLLNPKLARALGLAMWQYDLTGGLRIGKRHERLSRDDVLAHTPCLNADDLDSAYIYYDTQADDARLTLEIIRTAVIRHGAVAANRCEVTGLRRGGGRAADDVVTGADVLVDGEVIEVSASTIVNATGVWSDQIRALDEGVDPGSIRPAKGVHVSVPRHRLPTDVAVVVPSRADRRSVFVVPWHDVTYIGTTDTDTEGLEEPTCTPADIAYLLDAVNAATSCDLTVGDVTGSWAGLRPLVTGDGTGRTADLSRRHAVNVSPSGVITVTGGKLTTYRLMASDAVDIVAERRGHKRQRPCRTAKLPLVGAGEPEDDGSELGRHLHHRHGTQARVLSAMIDVDPSMGLPLVPGLPYVRAEAIHAVRHEMATTLDDVLSRRTRARLLDADATRSAAADVAALIGPELGWSDQRTSDEVAAFSALVDTDLAGVG